MKPLIGCIVVGTGMTVIGIVLLIGAVNGAVGLVAALAGLALLLLGPVVFIAGFVVDLCRRPTAGELARQKPDDVRTWHLRPLGLLLLVAGVAVCIVVGDWAGQFAPWIKAGKPPVFAWVFALLFALLLRFRGVRDLLFYSAPTPGEATASAADDPGEPA